MCDVQSDSDCGSECPLCMETLEVDDLNFFPCTCGYQICRFCWHRIRVDENGLCPACRKTYSDAPANYKPLSQEDVARIKTEKKQKDVAKKQKIAESRKHLACVRVVQNNLVFVVGLPLRLADVDILRKYEYFGKFGKIHKVAINHCAPASNNSTSSSTQPQQQQLTNGTSKPTHCTAYVTYVRSEDALRCIQTVKNALVDGRHLKATLGTTKYCANFLRATTCNKPDCMYLHGLGDENASFTKAEMQAGKHQEYEQRLIQEILLTNTGGGGHTNGGGQASSATSGGGKRGRKSNRRRKHGSKRASPLPHSPEVIHERVEDGDDEDEDEEETCAWSSTSSGQNSTASSQENVGSPGRESCGEGAGRGTTQPISASGAGGAIGTADCLSSNEVFPSHQSPFPEHEQRESLFSGLQGHGGAINSVQKKKQPSILATHKNTPPGFTKPLNSFGLGADLVPSSSSQSSPPQQKQLPSLNRNTADILGHDRDNVSAASGPPHPNNGFLSANQFFEKALPNQQSSRQELYRPHHASSAFSPHRYHQQQPAARHYQQQPHHHHQQQQSKDWQEGLRALLPSININFAAANKRSGGSDMGQQQQQPPGLQQPSWQQSQQSADSRSQWMPAADPAILSATPLSAAVPNQFPWLTSSQIASSRHVKMGVLPPAGMPQRPPPSWTAATSNTATATAAAAAASQL